MHEFVTPDPITESLLAVADFSDHLQDFDETARCAFVDTASAILAATPADDIMETVGSLLVTVFMAGREHRAAGHPSPVPRNSVVGDLYVPEEWS